MGNLERTLAEVEVLASELEYRYSSAKDAESSFRVGRTLSGIKNDAKLVYRKCTETYRALKKGDYTSASTSFSEMAMDSKNLADNLNIFLQTIYGKNATNLKDLKINTQRAPKLNDGRTLYQIFTATHDASKECLMKKARDCKGHNKGHWVLFKTPNEPGLQKNTPHYLAFHEENIKDILTKYGAHYFTHAYLSDEFFKTQAQSYLEMTKTILQTIADKDQEHFRRRNGNRKLKTLKQQASNFYHRHEKTARTIAGTALLVGGLVGGSLGTLQYQNMQKQKEMKDTLNKVGYVLEVDERFRNSFETWEFGWAEKLKEELIQKRKMELQQMLIAHPEFSTAYELRNVFGTNSNLFTQTLGEIAEKQRNIGVYIDNYLSAGGRLKSYFPKPENKAEIFLNQRQDFRLRLQKLLESSKGKVPSFEQLEELEKLSKEVSSLEDMEIELLPYIKPLSINANNMRPKLE